MKSSTAIVLTILVLIILGGVIWLFARNSVQQAQTNVNIQTGQSSTTQSTNGGTGAGGDVGLAANTQTVTTPSGLTFSYQPPYGLATGNEPIPASANAVIPPCDSGYDYCLYRTQPPVANSNYESAGLAITKRNLSTQTACLTTQPAGYTGLHNTTATHTGYATSVFSPVSGAAAGSSATGAVYRLWYGTTCYQFETRVAKAQYANFPAGTKTEFTSAMQATTMTELQNLLAGMTINGSTHVEFPAG